MWIVDLLPTLRKLSQAEHALAAPSHLLMFDVSGTLPSIRSLSLRFLQPLAEFDISKLDGLPASCSGVWKCASDQLSLLRLAIGYIRFLC